MSIVASPRNRAAAHADGAFGLEGGRGTLLAYRFDEDLGVFVERSGLEGLRLSIRLAGFASRHGHVAVVIAIVIALPVRPAAADDADPIAAPAPDPVPPPVKPWEQGVSDADRQAALDVFREGNAAYSESKYHLAATRYREALALWDHPRIHGNLASALIYLEEWVEASTEIERALAYGAEPFEPQVYERLRTSEKLLAAQLARLSTDCTLDDASVTLDGKELFVAPGAKTVVVETGQHEVVARRAGYLTESKRLVALGGQALEVSLAPIPLDEARVHERRWAVWKPWAVVGAGVAAGLAGIPLGQASSNARDQYEAGLFRECPKGCVADDIPDYVSAYQDRARLMNRLEISAYVVGAATAVAGAVLVYLNRDHVYEVSESGQRVGVTPTIGSDGVGVAFRGAF